MVVGVEDCDLCREESAVVSVFMINCLVDSEFNQSRTFRVNSRSLKLESIICLWIDARPNFVTTFAGTRDQNILSRFAVTLFNIVISLGQVFEDVEKCHKGFFVTNIDQECAFKLCLTYHITFLNY